MPRNASDLLDSNDPAGRNALPLRNCLRCQAAELLGEGRWTARLLFRFFALFKHAAIESISFTELQALLSMKGRLSSCILRK
jgi:hypothetical protein